MPLDKDKLHRRMAIYQASPEQKKIRAQRNAARAAAVKAGLVKAKGDPRDVHHKVSPRNGGTNAKGNLVVLHRSKNRAVKKKGGVSPKGK